MLDANGVAVYPWGHGEVLVASSLNAAIAQSSGANTGTSQPSNPALGTVWFNPATGLIEVWTGSTWQPASYLPLAGGTLTGPLAITRTDTTMPTTNVTPFVVTRNLNWTDSTINGWYGAEIVGNVNGNSSGEGPAGDLYVTSIRFTDNTLKSVASPTYGGDLGLSFGLTRNLPPGGIPSGRQGRDMFGLWPVITDNTNAPSSQGGAFVASEQDLFVNHVDDSNIRVLNQINMNVAQSLANGGYPASYSIGLLTQTGTDTTVYNHHLFAGLFSHAALDLSSVGSISPSITSTTPGAPVRSVVVNDIMPLESGGASLGSDKAPVSSTYAHVLTVNGATSASTTVVVSSAAYLATGMFVYDTLTSSGVPTDGTTITAINGTTLTLSNAATFANGATIVIARARKHVKINGNSYIVAGVTFSAAGNHDGRVYFTGNVTVADATLGNPIVPNNHAIWLNTGSAAAPWNDICFDANGVATLRSDGASGLEMTGNGLTLDAGNLQVNSGGISIRDPQGGWSATNAGKQLLVTTLGGNHPAIGMTDASGANLIGLINTTGTLRFCGMPAYSNSTTPEVDLLWLNSAGSTAYGPWTFSGAVTPSAGIVGTATNNNAAAGQVGEYISATLASGSPVTVPNASATNVVPLALTAGDWDVAGNVVVTGSATNLAMAIVWISTASASLPTAPNAGAYTQLGSGSTATYANLGLPSGTQRISLSVSTWVYLSVYASFATGTCSAFGFIGARRAR